MKIFNSKKEGGIMDSIRCDEENYLIWKWRPKGNEKNTTNKENSIRFGSSLRVKDGEMAVFVYKRKDGSFQDFIEGPYDDLIKTANLPIISNIIGSAYSGGSPFPAEVYFINLSSVIEFSGRVPYFDVFDPRYLDFPVPCAVKYQLISKINDPKEFIKIHRLIDISPDQMIEKMRPSINKYIKSTVVNVPKNNNIPVVQIETQLDEINEEVKGKTVGELENLFGIKFNMLNIDLIDIDKESESYQKLRTLTADITERKVQTQTDVEIDTLQAQSDVNIKNLKDQQRINSENLEKTLEVQREEMQRAQKLQTESANFETHKLNILTEAQKEVLKTAGESLGQMGNMNLGGGGDGSMNPAGMMTGMMMGGAMGNQMANMMNQMGNSMNPSSNQGGPPPPPQQKLYYVAADGKKTGPFNKSQLNQLKQNNLFNNESMVWTEGMSDWSEASNILDLKEVLGSTNQSNTPPPPPPPKK
jgi:membrane protease subunit (stomatin/prohibitin family)